MSYHHTCRNGGDSKIRKIHSPQKLCMREMSDFKKRLTFFFLEQEIYCLISHRIVKLIKEIDYMNNMK